MAVSKVKSTYSLDADTVRMLDSLARRWKVPKSEVLRRVIRGAAEGDRAGRDALRALDGAQRSIRLTGRDAARWQKRVREERRLSSRRGESAR